MSTVAAYEIGDSRMLELGALDDPNPLINQTQGITFSIQNKDQNAGGVYQWVQLVSSTGHATFTGAALRYSTNGFVLDTNYPYLRPIDDQDNPVDSPKTERTAVAPMTVQDIDSITRDDNFKMYLMWKWRDDLLDLNTDAIWVPLCVMAWHWDGGASEDQNGVWSLDYGSADHGPSVDTTEYPAWTDNYTNFDWEQDD